MRISSLAVVIPAAAALAGAFTARAGAQSIANFLVAPLSVNARTGFESEHVMRGKEHSDNNLRSLLNIEYQLPTTSFGSAIYGGALAVTPVEQTPNFFDYTAGGRITFERVAVGLGWIFHTFPNQNEHGLPAGGEQWALANKPVYNRSHEIELSVSTEFEGFMFAARAYYDLNLEQLTWEGEVRKRFEFQQMNGLGIEVGVYGGYVVGWQANGDQRAAGVAKWRNDYAYLGASADATYQIRDGITIGVGARIAWNSDGDTSWGTGAAGQRYNRLAGNTETNIWWGVWVRFAN